MQATLQPANETALEAAGVTPEMIARANSAAAKVARNCHGSGFRGRLGIFELMLMSSKIRELTFKEAPDRQIRRAAVGGHADPVLGRH